MEIAALCEGMMVEISGDMVGSAKQQKQQKPQKKKKKAQSTQGEK